MLIAGNSKPAPRMTCKIVVMILEEIRSHVRTPLTPERFRNMISRYLPATEDPTMFAHFNGSRLFAAGLMLLAVAAVSNAQDHKDKPTDMIRSVKSGAWSAGATWEGGKVPAAGARVQIREGHIVIYDVKSEAVIRFIHVAGTLSFANKQDTLLNVGLIKIQAGHEASENGFDCDAHVSPRPSGGEGSGVRGPLPALEVGSSTSPIDAKHNALIRLHYIEGTDKNSWPAIVCCGGRMDLHGAQMNRTWVRLGDSVKAGATEISLQEPVTGWKAGDRIIVTLTNRTYGKGGPTTEERIIKKIGYLVDPDHKVPDVFRISLDQPLSYDHLGTGEFRAEVANLSRNVTIESADPKGIRGHTMYHVGSAGSVSYAEFRHLGKSGVLGRYSLHFHLCGDTMRGYLCRRRFHLG